MSLLMTLTSQLMSLLMSLRKKLKAGMALTARADYVGRTYHNLDFCDTMTYQSQNFRI